MCLIKCYIIKLRTIIVNCFGGTIRALKCNCRSIVCKNAGVVPTTSNHKTSHCSTIVIRHTQCYSIIYSNVCSCKLAVYIFSSCACESNIGPFSVLNNCLRTQSIIYHIGACSYKRFSRIITYICNCQIVCQTSKINRCIAKKLKLSTINIQAISCNCFCTTSILKTCCLERVIRSWINCLNSCSIKVNRIGRMI